MRIQIGGEIIVIDPSHAPEGVDRGEIEAGADRVLAFAEPDLDVFDAETWQKRRPQSLLDGDDQHKPVLIWRFSAAGMVIEAPDEPLLVIADGAAELPWARWADGAVIVVAGDMAQGANQVIAALAAARLRLATLAGVETEVGPAIDRVRPHLGPTPLQVLEPGLAIEV